MPMNVDGRPNEADVVPRACLKAAVGFPNAAAEFAYWDLVLNLLWFLKRIAIGCWENQVPSLKSKRQAIDIKTEPLPSKSIEEPMPLHQISMTELYDCF